MDLKDLMSGMGIVIDDALDPELSITETSTHDRITEIVEQFKAEWGTPFYQASQMPREVVWNSLLESASFVLLDWKLWHGGGEELEADGIRMNLEFLGRAREFSVPVFIFTNEAPEHIAAKVEEIYDGDSLKRSFVFIQHKNDLMTNDLLNLDRVSEWVMGNASVHVLKKWDKAFRAARKDLFGSMYACSPNWPRVFWQSYVADNVNPGLALTEMINNSLRGRMQATAFDKELPNLPGETLPAVPEEQLRALIGATTFVKDTAEDEVRCGDLFKHRGKFFLNIRPDCDCIPRDGGCTDDILLYCIEGKKISDKKIREKYLRKHGQIAEKTNEAIVFSFADGDSILFIFGKLRLQKYGDWKGRRKGRLLHPYLTRIQQRYALFLQRQGLPRIPGEAIPSNSTGSECSEDRAPCKPSGPVSSQHGQTLAKH